MPGIFEVVFEDIERLDPLQLTKLLKTLLYLESGQNGIFESSATVPLKITVPDGGEDGRIEWESGPERTNWLPLRICLFQSKAEEGMTKADFKEASLVKLGRKSTKETVQASTETPRQRQLKSQVEEILNSGGAYIFFYGKHLTQEQLEDRVAGIREALKEAGRTDSDRATILILDANRIADWTNEYPAAIVRVCEWTRQSIPLALQTWESWHGYEEHRTFSFVDDDLRDKLLDLRSHLNSPRSIARVIGLPGLGKSRLAIEALSEPEGLMRQVVYVDASPTRPDLLEFVRQCRQKQRRALFVVDNCDLQLHKALRKEVTHAQSQLSLLTIDFNPEEQTGHSETDPLIRVLESSDEVISKLLEQVYGSKLPPSELSRIVHYAQGYPSMAELIARARINNKEDAATLNDDELLYRLVWGREQSNETARSVISACALFNRLGFDGEETHERKLVAGKFAQIDIEKFHEYAQDFIKRRIIQKHGDFVIVVPRPLALRLAADWWQRCSQEKALSLVNGELPEALLRALCEQTKMLGHVPNVKELTKKLCGEQGPFGKAEVLNTKTGSLLFRYLTEVSPENGAHVLNRLFGHAARDTLLEVGAGRRNLVWLLEKLCFRLSTFPEAARVLFNFAAAENETWANNATGQFKQLFQIYLSGTQAPFSLRTGIITEAIRSSDLPKQLLAVQAAGKAFETGHYRRTQGAEFIGSDAAMQDYQPKANTEILDYWSDCLDVLVFGACHESAELSDKAQLEIENIIYSCVSRGFIKPLANAVKTILNERPRFWSGALKRLDFTMRQIKRELSDEEESAIQDIYSLLNPHNLAEEIQQWITNPGWDYMHLDSDGNVVDESKAKAEALAKKCASSWPSWKDSLPLLLTGQQTHSFLFGQQLARSSKVLPEIIEEILAILRGCPDGDANPSLLGGILSELENTESNLVRKILDRVVADSSLVLYLIRLTISINPNESDLQRCLSLLSKVPIANFSAFAYGKVLDPLPVNTVKSFAEKILSSEQMGAWTALFILNMYSLNSDERRLSCSDVFRKIILSIDVLYKHENLSQMDINMWQETCERLLKADRDAELAICIADQIIAVCESEKSEAFFQFDARFKAILVHLISEIYLPVIWEKLSNALLTSDWRLKMRMQSLLGEYIKSPDDSPGVLFQLGNRFLSDWAKNTPGAPVLLARIVPIFAEQTSDATRSRDKFHPLTLQLLDEHGADEEVLRAISVNLGSISWVGSPTPIYESRLKLFAELLNHRIDSVRKWATMELESTKARLESSKKRDEEHAAGIYEKF